MRSDHRSSVSVAAAFVGLLASNITSFADGRQALVAGAEAKVAMIGSGATRMLHADQAARAFGWEAKVVTPGKLLTICRAGENGVCIPIVLGRVASRSTEEGLFVDAAVLATALRIEIEARGDEVTLRPVDSADDDAASVPAYNAAWGRGRGFRVGQTLPDIPLVDLDGVEVRFSRYLGKQYIIYCWASW